MIKRVGILLLLVLGVFLVYRGINTYHSWQVSQVEKTSRVLLEKVRAVTKLIAVEGHFSEILDYKDFWGYDISVFRKKALVRIHATVSIGYDLGGIRVESYPEEKKIVLAYFPEPVILSIDQELDYYDVTQGTFNAFTAEDYNKISRLARESIRLKATESGLFSVAETQAAEMLDLITFIVRSAGWTLELAHQENWPRPESSFFNKD